jgi:hypothetical protein
MTKKEPKLVLMPTLMDYNRDQVEAYIDSIRAKRMSATLEFYNTKNQKIQKKRDALGLRMVKQLEMLKKEIDALERAEGKAADRVVEIEQLRHQDEELAESMEEV